MTMRKQLKALQRHYPIFFWVSIVSVILVCAVTATSLLVSYLTTQNEAQKLGAMEESTPKCDIEESKETVSDLLEKHPVVISRLPSGDQIVFVSPDIYQGWRAYQTFCRVCHARDASGQVADSPLTIGAKTLAPNLQNSVCLGKEYFQSKIKTGGGGMPSWRDNSLVTTRLDQIYLYVAARTTRKLSYSRVDDRMLRVNTALTRSNQ